MGGNWGNLEAAWWLGAFWLVLGKSPKFEARWRRGRAVPLRQPWGNKRLAEPRRPPQPLLGKERSQEPSPLLLSFSAWSQETCSPAKVGDSVPPGLPAGRNPRTAALTRWQPPVCFVITQFVRLVSMILQVRNERFIPQEAGLAASTVCKPLRAASAFLQVFPSCLSPPLGG